MVRIMMLIDIWLHLQIAITRNMFPQNNSKKIKVIIVTYDIVVFYVADIYYFF